MNPITTEQVIQAIDSHNIKRFEHSVCATCNRGERFLFYRTSSLIKADVYRRSGCDCAWQESQRMGYDDVAEFFNQQTPERRAELWAILLASGEADQPVPQPETINVVAATETEPMVTADAVQPTIELELTPEAIAQKIAAAEASTTNKEAPRVESITSILPVKIAHYEDNINRTPALLLATEGWLELRKANLCDDLCNIYPGDSAIVASCGDSAIGVLTYRVENWGKTIIVAVGYVCPEYRRTGVYTKLWHALVARAIELKIPMIHGNTHVNNTAMQQIMKKLDRELLGTMHFFAVPLPPDAEV